MMVRKVLPVIMVFCLVISFQTRQARGGFGDFIKSIEKSLGGGELSDETIIDGLKEALEVGTENAVGLVSRVDGYYKNPKIKIPLPESVQKVEKVLRTVGYGDMVDEFDVSMNRAAERAAPEAKSIFVGAIKEMSIADARNILDGPDDAATLYFKDKTLSRLQEVFKPIVHKAMTEVGVTRQYQVLNDKLKDIPFVESLSMDLDAYVTDRALDGLFIMVAEEERKIREDPAARVTDLLKEVFGRGN